MDILRTIKLKDVFGELENMTPEEKLFFQLHVNLHEISAGQLYNNYDEWVVHYDFENHYFYYNYYRFYLVFKEKIDINVQHFNVLCTNILENQLNCKQFTPLCYRY